MTITAAQATAEAQLIATVAAPFLPPNAQAAFALAMQALAAVQATTLSGVDVTNDALAALFDADAAARAADKAAQAAIA